MIPSGLARFAGAVSSGLGSGVAAFRQSWLGTPAIRDDEWGEWEYRAGRYELLWAFYRSSQYQEDVHRWAQKFKSDFSLYTDIRTVFGSGRRLGEFWATHLWGGSLDPRAGNGSNDPSALPIREADAAVQGGIARLWLDSDWQSKKDVMARFGAVMGDVGLKVVDDPAGQKVRLEVVHPGRIRAVKRDPYGAVLSYLEAERREDPERSRQLARPVWCDYSCQVDLVGGEVFYQTFRDGRPYDWPDNPPDSTDDGVWSRPYGWVPLVLVQHIDIGADWGDSEVYGILDRTMAVDSLGSMLNDQVAKLLNSPWMVAGVTKISVEMAGGKEKMPMFAAPKDATATAMVAPMPVEEVKDVIASIMSQIELDYPELMVDRARSSGDMSGKTLREARKPAESKVQSRRAAYDRALVAAHRMALAMGSMQGYEGYRDLPTDVSASGPLGHRIGDRNVFKMDAFDRYEEQLQRAAGVAAFTAFGMPVDVAMREYDFEPDVISATVTEREKRIAAGFDPSGNSQIGGGKAGANGAPSPEQTTARPTFDRQPVT